MERHGASHRISSWKPSAGNVTSMSGTLVSTHSDLDEHELGQERSVWQPRSGGYTAEVQHREPVVGGADYTTYGAGPFKTQRRAEIAAESLGSRAYRGRADYYRKGTQTLSYEDLMPEGASMRRRY